MSDMPRICVLRVEKGPFSEMEIRAVNLKRFSGGKKVFIEYKESYRFERKYERPIESDSGGRG